MKNFDHKEVEKKWKDHWFTDNIYAAEDFSDKPKKFIMAEFPYPSGTRLHMGHVMRYTIPEIYSRKLRMSGYNVLFPMGWDAFGLPAENYAVKTGVHPAETTEKAVNTFRELFQNIGYAIDWSREVNTTDPKYYKWTQWIFLRLFEAGLAELKEEPVWWCETLKTVLANEEVIEDKDGNKVSERGEHPVEKRMLKQWVLKIPEYADKLLEGLETIEFPESIKAAQRNWIGRSEGAKVKFRLKKDGVDITNEENESFLEVFTTRPDTIYGVTFMVVAPEHSILKDYKGEITNLNEVEEYINKVKNKSDLERQSEKEKTGVEVKGLKAVNPINGKEIPIFVSDYVLISYGTGSIMAVPAHDERDLEFAKKYGIEIINVVEDPGGIVSEGGDAPSDTKQDGIGHKQVRDDKKPQSLHSAGLGDDSKNLFTDYGVLINSDEFNGLTSEDAKSKIIEKLENLNLGKKEVVYKLRDWLFSRQRYWGEPIPLIHREDGSIEEIVNTNDVEGVKEKLPLILPEVPDYNPSSDGSSPLAKNIEWVNIVDKDGKTAKRETNTMPNWAGSCWYYLRYIDPHNDEAFADPEKMKYWLPVDKYFGGSEHTTLHLLYSRFWHKFLYDEGLVPTPEPYAWRMNGGLLLGPDGDKMSKSKGNVINPDDIIEKYGVDALRLYICFMGPYDATIAWNESGVRACRNLIDTIVSLQDRVTENVPENKKLITAYHKMVKKVTDMMDNLKMNTCVSEFMIFVNELKKADQIDKEIWKGFLKLIAPFTVFVAEDLWQKVNSYELQVTSDEFKKENSVHLQKWPEFDAELAKDETVVLGIQVNGKVRGEVEVEIDESEESVREKVMANGSVKKWLEGSEGRKEVKKFIYIPGKIVSIVI